ncbi:protein FAM110A-like [Brienomyrus brachyistius]|uniref:protein FAM110A-like n=1 Tax=Brienomyrus brachyistius TaxID=42636 RepID=UPI0020B3BABC|nr:protein FAM110A-like [Brienomyrus brachyistius]
MSVETLRPSSGRIVVAPVTTATPIRLRNKGPDYFRRPEAPEVGRPSAVERLEADKAKYVKSHQVIRTKQEPVCAPATPTRHPARTTSPQTTPNRPIITHTKAQNKPTPPLPTIPSPKVTAVISLAPSSRLSRPPPHRPLVSTNLPQAITRKTKRPETHSGSVLNLETLSNLINVSDTPPPSITPTPTSPLTPDDLVTSDSPSTFLGSLPGFTEPNCTPPLSPPVVAVRRVDVRPPRAQAPPLRVQLLQHPHPHPSVLSPPPASPASTCSLQRSKSDLSDRFSRVPADLERFFNYCGLDPSDMQGLAWTGSDITSLSRLRSASAPGSKHGGPSQDGDQEPDEEGPPTSRVPYGMSVIERNARVIKWLYGLRQTM